MFFTQVKEPFLKNCISQSALSTPKSLSVHKKTFVQNIPDTNQKQTKNPTLYESNLKKVATKGLSTVKNRQTLKKVAIKRLSTVKNGQSLKVDDNISRTQQKKNSYKLEQFCENSFKKLKQDNFLSSPNQSHKQNLTSKNSIYKNTVQNDSSEVFNANFQAKWQKTIELYSMKSQLTKLFSQHTPTQNQKKYQITPGIDFYKILMKDRTFQKDWKINFPQTIFLDPDHALIMIYTDQNGFLRKKIVQKSPKQKGYYYQQVLDFKKNMQNQLKAQNKLRLLSDIKFQQNPNIPLMILKYNDQSTFETDVQSYRMFLQRKLKPTSQTLVQRYIYSNNLKANVFRLYYRKKLSGSEMRPQYEGIKFENQKSIFKQSLMTSFPQTHKYTSTINLSQKRVNSITYTKVMNQKALEKYILIVKQLLRLLQYTQKVTIDKLYVDFVVDMFEKPWIINIKLCEVNPYSTLHIKPTEDQINNVSSCRLCGAVSKKQDLKNSVTIKMMCQFMQHLRKRTKTEDLFKIDFVNYININSKQNKASAVCKMCYQVIIQELQLIKMEKQLAQICNIIPITKTDYVQGQNSYATKGSINVQNYKQWRLMLYFEGIKNISQAGVENRSKLSKNVSKFSCPYTLRYQLSPKLQQSFKCEYQPNDYSNLNINKVKLHYFYSQDNNIQEFINNTEIVVSLFINEQDNDKRSKGVQNTERLAASGSTHVLSTFNLYKSSSISLKTLMENGQRQTATVLLFFKDRKYCELNLKVGLVFDGSYQVQNIPHKGDNNADLTNFIKCNQVWFSKSLWNSNPLPKQWMQIFGSRYNYNTGEQQQNQTTDQILKAILANKDTEQHFDQ